MKERGKFYIGDCLEVLKGFPTGKVNLIYLDPPFLTGKDWEGKAGKFSDKFKDDDEYMKFLYYRIYQMRRVLKEEGTLYLHCDPKISPVVRHVLDEVFGSGNFRNEIVWCYNGGGVPKNDFPRKHDTILRYTKTANYTFNTLYKEYSESTKKNPRHSTLSGGKSIDIERGTPVTDVWDDIKIITSWGKERIGYPTQKPVALLERIIKVSSNENDIVLDPMCGSGTTCVASTRLSRRWLGIDKSKDAIKAAEKRISEG